MSGSARFVDNDPETIYLDGNSLGRLPGTASSALEHAVSVEWGTELIDAWEHWITLPHRIGDLLARSLLGAPQGSVVVSDSTTVNFYKLACAALDARPDRRVIVTDRQNFPTDRYVLEGIAEARGAEILWLDSDPIYGPTAEDVERIVDNRTALVTFSHVAYRSAALADMKAINAVAREAGALNLWDLSHSVGAVPVALAQWHCDLAVGCTYKYLNGGPGSPAFLYVDPALHAELRQPIWGWFGQTNQFAMGEGYEPVPDISRFLVGTPPVLSLAATLAGVQSIVDIGIESLRAQSITLCEHLIALADEHLEPLGFTVGSPRAAAERGGHVLLGHRDGLRISIALREVKKVIGDFRPPDGLRLAPVAAYISPDNVTEAIDRLASLVASGRHQRVDPQSRRVT